MLSRSIWSNKFTFHHPLPPSRNRPSVSEENGREMLDKWALPFCVSTVDIFLLWVNSSLDCWVFVEEIALSLHIVLIHIYIAVGVTCCTVCLQVPFQELFDGVFFSLFYWFFYYPGFRCGVQHFFPPPFHFIALADTNKLHGWLCVKNQICVCPFHLLLFVSGFESYRYISFLTLLHVPSMSLFLVVDILSVLCTLPDEPRTEVPSTTLVPDLWTVSCVLNA